MPIIDQMLRRMKGRSRWVPHNFNPADGLTKLKGAHMAPLMSLLQTGFYHLKTEEAQLASRAAEKEATGVKSRLKQSKTPTSLFCSIRSSARTVDPARSPQSEGIRISYAYRGFWQVRVCLVYMLWYIFLFIIVCLLYFHLVQMSLLAYLSG